MQSYKRKITYFYEHHKDNVGTTAGFLKLEIRGDKVKIIVNIQEPMGLPYQEAELYFYHEAGDHLAAVKTGEVERVNGMLIYQNRTDWQNMYGTGRDLYTFDGVAVVYNDSHYYIGDFKDKDRRNYPLDLGKTGQGNQKDKKSDRTENFVTDSEDPFKTAVDTAYRPGMRSQQKGNGRISEIFRQSKEEKNWYENIPSPDENTKEKNVYDKCESCPYYKKRKEQQESKTTFEKMLAEYPKLPMYGASELFDCVRIHPRDIGRLDMRNWKLGVNSFLTHGFYTYQYLLLGKMRFDNGREQPIIGVPGVFSNRDKYLANMFGFDQFIPVKKTGTKTGEFGYWIVELQ
ncbi:MAG: DUF6128 domain-containing protein [Clostridium sp.]|nr:DUF6128 domain-containing protein [Clostridium sp.]